MSLTRRASLGFLAGALATPLLGQAEGRTVRLAIVSSAPRSRVHVALFEAFQRAGFFEGKNLIVIGAFSTDPEKIEGTVAEVVQASPDAIYAGGDAVLRAALRATKTIPIVSTSDDMLRTGLANSLSEPRGNFTGVSIFATELNGKREEILFELLPHMRRLATLADPESISPDRLQVLTEAAEARGVALTVYNASTREEIRRAVEAARSDGAEALNVLASPIFHGFRGDLFAWVAAARLPAIYQWPEYVEEGALMGYGPRLDRIYGTLSAPQLIKIFNGVKVSEIPVEQPTEFELGINLKTAQALGLTIPDTLFARADQVIQ